MYKEAKKKDKVLNEMIIHALDQEMEKCTFEPQIVNRRGSRGFHEFLKEQQEREAKRENEIRRLKEDKEAYENSQRQPSPTISPVFFTNLLLDPYNAES